MPEADVPGTLQTSSRQGIRIPRMGQIHLRKDIASHLPARSEPPRTVQAVVPLAQSHAAEKLGQAG